MKVALAQIDCKVGDIEHNCAKFSHFASRAKRLGAQVIVFPEMSDTGYILPVIAQCAEPWPGKSFNAARAAAIENSIGLVCGISERVGDLIYNSLAFFDASGELIGKYRKSHLFAAGATDESDVFSSGDKFTVVHFGEFNWGLSICYDLRFPELYRALALRGANVLLNCTAWPASRPIHWDCLTRARSVENQAFMIGVDRVGADGQLTMHGHSRVVTPRGEILCEAGNQAEELLVAELDFALIEEFRRAIPSLASRRGDLYGDCCVE